MCANHSFLANYRFFPFLYISKMANTILLLGSISKVLVCTVSLSDKATGKGFFFASFQEPALFKKDLLFVLNSPFKIDYFNINHSHSRQNYDKWKWFYSLCGIYVSVRFCYIARYVNTYRNQMLCHDKRRMDLLSIAKPGVRACVYVCMCRRANDDKTKEKRIKQNKNGE